MFGKGIPPDDGGSCGIEYGAAVAVKSSVVTCGTLVGSGSGADCREGSGTTGAFEDGFPENAYLVKAGSGIGTLAMSLDVDVDIVGVCTVGVCG
jgi:hypothetical protein